MSEKRVSHPRRASGLRPQARRSISLSDLFCADSCADPGVHIRGITADSRLVEPDDLYVALPGSARHGAMYAVDALAAGAAAILTDEAGRGVIGQVAVPVHVVADPRRAMAGLAARIYGCPASSLRMLAVTGTNGKTTTTFLLDAALRAAGHRVGIVGTVGFLLDGQPLTAVRNTVTTPEAPELQALLGYLLQAGADSVAMEVSSHALALGRADAIQFDVAGFTNFGRDHLDFHGDEESYFEAKASLFTPGRTRHAVINIDDSRGPQLVERIRAGGLELTTVSLDKPTADCFAASLQTQPDGRIQVIAQLNGQRVKFLLNLPGEFNVRNALTCIAMLDAAGIELQLAAEGLGSAQVPGRMQRVDLGPDGPLVYVDFAHTPQAVTAALAALQAKRRIVVLGCGGDRDRDKRGPMGAAAAAGADVVIITDDNPRSEVPAAIRAQVMAGAEAARRERNLAMDVIDGGDRRAAIRLALGLAKPGDAIAVLGKGHETGQEIGGRILPFDDASVISQEWSRQLDEGSR